MEVDRKGMLWWQNVVTLMRLHFIQNRKSYLILMLFELGCVALSVALAIQGVKEAGVGYHALEYGSGAPLFGMYLIIIIFCICSYSSVSNKYISMYPGTRSTRYVSRVLLDHLVLTGFCVYFGVLYIISAGIYRVVQIFVPAISLKFFFSWKYLGAGCLRVWLMAIMIYAMFQVLYLIIQKLGVAKYTIACVVIFMGMAFLINTSSRDWVMDIGSYFFSFGRNWAELFSRSVVTWIVCMLLAGVLALCGKMVKPVFGLTWIAVLSVLILYVGLNTITEQRVGVREGDSYGWHFDGMESPENRPDISRDFIVTLPQEKTMEFLKDADYEFAILNGKKKNFLWSDYLRFQGVIRSVSSMQGNSAGAVDSEKVTGENMVLRLKFTDLVYDGKSVYEEFLNDMTITQTGKIFYYETKDCCYIFNFMFGNAYFLAGIADEDMSDWLFYSMLDREPKEAIFVIEDETADNWEQYKESVEAEGNK